MNAEHAREAWQNLDATFRNWHVDSVGAAAIRQAIDVLKAVNDELDAPVVADMDIDEAMRLARLWTAGKLVGGDWDAVLAALLREVDRLRGV